MTFVQENHFEPATTQLVGAAESDDPRTNDDDSPHDSSTPDWPVLPCNFGEQRQKSGQKGPQALVMDPQTL